MCVAVFHGERGHRDQVLGIAVHAGGMRFASCSMDHSIKVWSMDVPEVQEVRNDISGGAVVFADKYASLI